VWVEATCEKAKTCEICGETEGEALGHAWVEATCEEPKTCSNCKATEGDALGHDWVYATFDNPKTCNTCGKTEGGLASVEELDLSAVKSYRWYGIMGPDDVIAVDSNYNFYVVGFDGTIRKEIGQPRYDDIMYSWGFFQNGDSYIFYINNPDDDGFKTTFYDKNFDTIKEVTIPYSVIEAAVPDGQYLVLFEEFVYFKKLSDDYGLCYLGSDNKEPLYYINLNDYSLVTLDEYEESEETSSDNYAYEKWIDYADCYLVETLDESQWGFVDAEGNELAFYKDASAFSPDGYAFVSNDRETYSIIDRNFNVVAEDFIAGVSSSYSSISNYFAVKGEDQWKYFRITVGE